MGKDFSPSYGRLILRESALIYSSRRHFYGDCIYCGKPAGFLRRSHRECREKHDLGWEAMVRLARDAVLGTEELEGIEDRLAGMAEEHFIKGERVREALIAGWEEAVQHFR